MVSKARQKAESRGRRAEWLAALALQMKGYRILARRARTPMGEIDLIVRRGRVIAFIEVKQRPTTQAAAIAVPDANWRRIANAASHWAARYPALSSCDWRYDLIAVAPFRWPKHFKDYWRP